MMICLRSGRGVSLVVRQLSSNSSTKASTTMSFIDQLLKQQKDSPMRQALDAVRELPFSSAARAVERAAIDHAFDTFGALTRRGTVATLSEIKLLLKTIIRAKLMLNSSSSRTASSPAASSSASASKRAAASSVSARLQSVMAYVDESLLITDVEYWNLIATIYTFERKPNELIEILKLMKERNVIPDHDTAKIVLESLVYSSECGEFVDEAYANESFGLIHYRNDASVMASLVLARAYAQASRCQQLYDLLLLVSRHRILLSAEFCQVVCLGLSRDLGEPPTTELRVAAVKQLFNAVYASDTQLTHYAAYPVLSCLYKLGATDDADSLFAAMAEDALPSSKATFFDSPPDALDFVVRFGVVDPNARRIPVASEYAIGAAFVAAAERDFDKARRLARRLSAGQAMLLSKLVELTLNKSGVEAAIAFITQRIDYAVTTTTTSSRQSDDGKPNNNDNDNNDSNDDDTAFAHLPFEVSIYTPIFNHFAKLGDGDSASKLLSDLKARLPAIRRDVIYITLVLCSFDKQIGVLL